MYRGCDPRHSPVFFMFFAFFVDSLENQDQTASYGIKSEVYHGLDPCASIYTEIFLASRPISKNPQKNSPKWIWFDLSFWCVFCSFDPQIYCLRALPTLPPCFLQPICSIHRESEDFSSCSSTQFFRPKLRSGFSASGGTTGRAALPA